MPGLDNSQEFAARSDRTSLFLDNILHRAHRYLTSSPPVNSRRDFLKTVAAAGALGAVSACSGESTPPAQVFPSVGRPYWISVLDRLANPVLTHLAAGTLKAKMPVETMGNVSERRGFTHLEAYGRLVAGISPWLGATGLPAAETALQAKYLGLTRQALDVGTDPKSPDFLNFCVGAQPVVDAAFLAQGLLRAKSALWEPLEERVKKQVIAALKSSRAVPTPVKNNWTLFAAIVEAALLEFGEPTLEDRLEAGVRRMLQWYEGDGLYGDAEYCHFDYYHSFVIHPMLVDTLAVLATRDTRLEPAHALCTLNGRVVMLLFQERLIGPDGTFPSIGRSTTYRFGAFHALAQVSLAQGMPEHIVPAQVRCAMTAVIRKMAEAPGTFDENGWLKIGFCGHQPELGETYISTGSLYLAAVGLLPLGLPASDPFWSGPDTAWTSQKLWERDGDGRRSCDHRRSVDRGPYLGALSSPF